MIPAVPVPLKPPTLCGSSSARPAISPPELRRTLSCKKGQQQFRPAPMLGPISALLLLKMFKTHLQNKKLIKPLDVDKVYTQQEHRRAISFFLGFGSRKTILMEHTGEQITAGEVAG